MKQGAEEATGIESTSQNESAWLTRHLEAPFPAVQHPQPPPGACLRLLRQDYETLERNRSVIQTSLKVGTKQFQRGLGTHSWSRVQILSPEPMATLKAWVGLDHNERTSGGRGSVRFAVIVGGKTLFRSGVFRGGQEPEAIEVNLGGATALELEVDDAGDGPACDHADWAEARLETQSGRTLWLDELPDRTDTRLAQYPFSFIYGDKHSDSLLSAWKQTTTTTTLDTNRTQTAHTWTDPKSGLRVEWHVIRFVDFPAVEWIIYFENTSTQDTASLADVQAIDMFLNEPMPGPASYRLHRTRGAPSNPTDFEPKLVAMTKGSQESLGGGGGRSSNKDFPFVKIESATGSCILAVGWSGQWAMRLNCRADNRLHMVSGLELTHFNLHPGERVRTPRMLLLRHEGDTLEANALFRQLIYRHYAARRNGQPPLPTLFCNTCFTRGGGWLNECNEGNQISLLRAYAPLGLEALITDAGWFEGGWPAGAGNWNPRREAYPHGMGPVAAAAKEHGMVYGLWFEFERVMSGTTLAAQHPGWLLKSVAGTQDTLLLNLGLPEVRQYLFNIVKRYMDLPGFRFYRSDFNMDPLPYWRHTDTPDRQGMAEMKYIEGLYAFWDQLAQAWPDAFREECASGGRRIDLETIQRMHFHQESDYWFDNEVDLAVIWSLSRYLPNSTFTTPLIRLDDRSFHSTLATSLIPGWIADDKGFDQTRAQRLTETYRRLRPLLVGAYYPLTPYTRDGKHWMALQFHRPDLGQGLVLVVPPKDRTEGPPAFKLYGLVPQAIYELSAELTGRHEQRTGAELMNGFVAPLPPGNDGERIVYVKKPK